MWAWLRREPAVPAAAPRRVMPFDVVVDLGPKALAGLAAEDAMKRAAGAIERLPGAGRVRVRLGNGPAAVTTRIFPAGRSELQHGEPWVGLHAAVEAAVVQVLAQPAPERPRIPGFAEGTQHLDALAALASLAQSVQRPAPRPAAPAAASREADIAMMSRLLGFVLPTEDRATAGAAVQRFGSYAAVLAAPASELRSVPGLGPHSIAAIKLVHEAAVRLARAGVTGQPVLDEPARLTAYLAAALARERVEQFRILFLDERGMLKADEVQATGTVNHTPVYPREVVRRALELGAAALVLVHNHPSGDPTPSRDDIEMTAEIKRAADALGIALRDHIIVGNGRTLSFLEAGLI